MYKKMSFFLLTSLFYFLLLPQQGCAVSSEPVQQSGYYFDTVVTLTAYGKNAEAVLEEAFALCERYENLFSHTKEGSDIWRINHAQQSPVEVDPETAYLISCALECARRTDGLLDPTVTILSDLWNFTGDPPGPVPAQAQLNALLPHVGYEAVQLTGNTVTLTDPQAKISLGFLAKGYIADRIKECFLEQGMEYGLINLGGNVLAVGTKPDQSPYRAGIQKPFGIRSETVRIIELSDRSLVSSGSYERFFTENDVLYHHILDPGTGYPADTDLSGVTILSDSSLEGDALSTLCFLLGQKKGQELIESLPNIEALFILTDGAVVKTDAFP